MARTDTATRYPNLTAAVAAEGPEFDASFGEDFEWAGYTEAELRLGFNAVKDPENWKFPIRRVFPTLTTDEIAVVEAAVGFYAGGEAFVYGAPEGTIVSAPGYYAVIGA